MKSLYCAGGPLGADSDYEILRAPIILKKGDKLRQRRFKLAPDFAWQPNSAAIFSQDAADISIEDVELVGSEKWLPRWFEPGTGDAVDQQTGYGAPVGMNWNLAGMRLQGAPGLHMERVRVVGFPRAGIETWSCDSGVFEDLSFERCLQGLLLRDYGASRNVKIQKVRVRDTWGPPHGGKWPGIGGPPSARPGEFIGSDGVVLGAVQGAKIKDVIVAGEILCGMKIGLSRDVEVSQLRATGFAIQATVKPGDSDKTNFNITLRDSVIDKGFGVGDHVENGNALQISFNVRDFRVLDTIIRNPGGKNGSAIEFAGNVHGEVRGCTIEGFNGTRGGNQCGALSLDEDTSSVNADFEIANTFVNQQRVVARW